MAGTDSLFDLNSFSSGIEIGEGSGLDFPASLTKADIRFLESVFALSPYLARLARSRLGLIATLKGLPVAKVLDDLQAHILDLPMSVSNESELAGQLRQLKGDAHLVHALGELSGALDIMESAEGLSRLADACIRAALEGHVRLGLETGKFEEPADWANPLPGVFILALGKLGAEELNFSSDIDLVALYDSSALTGLIAAEPERRLPRLIKALSRLLHDDTPDGYVFRMDLRLRPDPSSTPAILSINAAMNYYESRGQNWERAAYIKARPCAGDRECAVDFLANLRPFIWRRTLDYGAVEDIHSLARQIQSVGARARIKPAGHDLKLGRGGIREIEFTAQIPQLVLGGRQPELRIRSPFEALDALAASRIVEPAAIADLKAEYRFLRSVEHRLQMVSDEQTQELPCENGARRKLAIFCGFPNLEEFDDRITSALQTVHGHFSSQFGAADSLADELGSLVFTGVDPAKETLNTLSAMGFQFPDIAWARMNAWLSGGARAMRTTRARQVLTRLAPRLLRAMADTGEPDSALTRFAAFIEGLPIGVQPLSMLENEPDLARELVTVIGLAPSMATTLAQRPAVMDVMMDAPFARPLKDDPTGELGERMAAHMSEAIDPEDAMNRARRLVREERFRIGSQLLVGRADFSAAGRAFGDVADLAISAMATVALERVVDRFGDPPGRFSVLGLGKLGSRELAADSDLDIMLVYDPADGAEGEAPSYFSRFAQRLVSALSAPTEEGSMYEIDMQLRPSGKAGPIAVRLSSFRDYYLTEAWTWERMALTRLRAITGDAALIADIAKAINAALVSKRSSEQIISDALEMRRRLERERPAIGDWDLKLRPGGILDIEFVAQLGQLLLGQAGRYVPQPDTAAQIRSIEAAGLLTNEDADLFCRALKLWLSLSQIIRTAHGSGFDPNSASSGFSRRLSKLSGQASMSNLIAHVNSTAREVRKAFELNIGHLSPDATETPSHFVEWVRGNN
ncbi:bifunctional [glutamine synthetase] adenylyltransferase/[glutamine synthetase]-adenylyl-L-tyrosine phosphorylase [Hyphobacterium sp.]|uniref:bifunctional [glutamine synthetase] adenylyltransferase/[glutamine synthetase]-adenylyl-L-tyrosine phosphorylase n=1 Tax=Hyphobacterium sp. TaxID=2004662 RepID=UPI003BAB65DD